MGARRADWVTKTSELLRTGVEYFQVVFTIPQDLSSLVLGNRTKLYRLLFRSASESLGHEIAKQCGMQAASTMVLHTWNQRLGHHPHIHAPVPGSGPSLCGTRWVPCRYTKTTPGKPDRPFLVDNRALGRQFRDSYIRGIKRMIKSGELAIKDQEEVEKKLADVAERDWVVYIQPPPKGTGDPADVLKYLARYMTGGPISDRRLIKLEDGRVHFWARSRDKSGKPKRTSLPTVEFVRCWTLHILSKGFTKVRCYGGWSNRLRDDYLRNCERLQPHPSVAPDVPAETSGSEAPEEPVRKCPNCQTPMDLESSELCPRWRDLFYGPDHPQWVEWMGSG